MPKKLTQAEFIAKAVAVHGDKYDYSQIAYIGSRDKVRIACHAHGVFEQAATNHINGQGCPVCGRKASIQGSAKARTKTLIDFIEAARLAHGLRYDYSKSAYTGSGNKISIRCPEHGVFEQIATAHLGGHGCKKCADNKLSREKASSAPEFIEKATLVHDGRYTYKDLLYKNNTTLVSILCRVHGYLGKHHQRT